MANRQEQNVIATADDAILAKLATVRAGYYDDPFLEPFSRQAAGIAQQGPRMRRQVQPIIKRGTHARVCCMDRAISAFLNSPAGTRQVVVLGCGKDTSFFRHDLPTDVRWFEVDHPSVLQTKATIVQESPNVFAGSTVQRAPSGFCISTNTKVDDKNNQTKACHLIEHDLAESPQKLVEKLQSTTAQINLQAPTLFLFECVLMYCPHEASRSLLSCFAQHFANAVVCCYEPILGTDTFGTVMEQNLIHAGVASQGSCLRTTRSLDAQLDKLVQCGFQTAVGCDMALAYQSILTQAQRTRADRSEFLDELEEWTMIMRHYCFVVATNSPTNEYFCSIGPESASGFIEGKCQKKTKV